MFHLLVSFEGWPDGAGSISTDRIYIKPDEAPGNAFLSNGKLNIDKINKVPALLVNETGGRGPQFARIAYITSLAQGSRDTSIQYAVDTSIAPISNEDIDAYSNHLGIGKLNLTHTHWQVCNADIFKIFLLSRQNRAIGPKVFSAESINKQEPDLVSVMMPFSAEFKPVLTALQSATSSLDLRCVRADDIWEHHAIVQDIVNLIAKARVVVCDCSGKNANVFYEIGIAHSLGKEVLLIAQSESDVPFDLRHLRHIRYLPNKEGLDALSAAVQSRLRTVIAGAI